MGPRSGDDDQGFEWDECAVGPAESTNALAGVCGDRRDRLPPGLGGSGRRERRRMPERSLPPRPLLVAAGLPRLRDGLAARQEQRQRRRGLQRVRLSRRRKRDLQLDRSVRRRSLIGPRQRLHRPSRRRTNWGTESVNPPFFSNPDGGPFTYLSPVSSPDLSKTLQLSTTALAPGAIQGGSNVYIRDDRTGSVELVAALPGRNFFNSVAIYETFFITASPDWSHLLLQSAFPLTGETTEGVNHLYEFSGGRLQLLDRLPDGTIPPGGAALVSVQTPNTNQMSADGSRVFFSAALTEGAEPALFMRETRDGHATTVPISTVHQPGPNEGEVVGGTFGGASANGSVVYFTSYVALTPGAAAGGPILYRYDVDTETLTDVTPTTNPNGPQVGQVLGVSEDGSYVYFSSTSALAEGEPQLGGANFYVVHDGSNPELIGSTDPTRGESISPKEWLTSPNGRYFALASLSPLTPEVLPGTEAGCPQDNFLGNAAGVCLQVFRYDAVAGHLECVSCGSQVPAGPSFLGGFRSRREPLGSAAPHAMLDDGTAYFETKNALMPGDVNEIRDVYANQSRCAGTGVDRPRHGPCELRRRHADRQQRLLPDRRAAGQARYRQQPRRL